MGINRKENKAPAGNLLELVTHRFTWAIVRRVAGAVGAISCRTLTPSIYQALSAAASKYVAATEPQYFWGGRATKMPPLTGLDAGQPDADGLVERAMNRK